MENKTYKKRNGESVINSGLAGRFLNLGAFSPLKEGHVYTKEDMWKIEVEGMIKNAETREDLNAIGVKFNMAIDNKYNLDTIWDYQMKAAKKMTEIYNKQKVEVKIA